MYKVNDKKIIIYDLSQFNIDHILLCGQVFSFKKLSDAYLVLSKDKSAYVHTYSDRVEIVTDYLEYFINYFDLQIDYNDIKSKLSKYEFLQEPIEFGYGIRILNQDIFETIISFIVSQNNNIKRIQKILFAIRENYGKKIGDYYAFPTVSELSKATEEDLKKIGLGYRAKYICESVKVLINEDIQNMQTLSTPVLKQKLLSLYGIGNKVADCILLFAFHRFDNFPVDTWIEKVYYKYFDTEKKVISRQQISEKLVGIFGQYAGYAQQYLFYFIREKNNS